MQHMIRSGVKSCPFRTGAWTSSRTEIPDQIVSLKFDRFRPFVAVLLHHFCTSSCVFPNEGVGLGHEFAGMVSIVICWTGRRARASKSNVHCWNQLSSEQKKIRWKVRCIMHGRIVSSCNKRQKVHLLALLGTYHLRHHRVQKMVPALNLPIGGRAVGRCSETRNTKALAEDVGRVLAITNSGAHARGPSRYTEELRTSGPLRTPKSWPH